MTLFLRLPGHAYWIDGTRSHEHGDLATLAYSDLKAALVLDPGTARLQAIPGEPTDAARKSVRTAVDLRAGLEKPAKLRVESTYYGEFNAGIRRSFERSSREKTAREYLNYYAKHYPSVRTLHAPEIRDDPQTDKVSVIEQYLVDDPAEHSNKGEISVTVRADEIYPYVHLPDTRIRSSPIAVPYPASVTQAIVVSLPEEWKLEPADFDVRNDVFHYHSSVRYESTGRQATVTYLYEALTDTVPVP